MQVACLICILFIHFAVNYRDRLFLEKNVNAVRMHGVFFIIVVD
jgi:hypothetical protein